MGGKVRLSESELKKLKDQTKQQQEKLGQVIQQINAAVTGRDWRSRAASSFAERWRSDMAVLKRLQDDLVRWSQELQGHEDLAREMNRPFRQR